jgi:hypothetical protein
MSHEFKVLTSKGEIPGNPPGRRGMDINEYLARVLAPRPAAPAAPRSPPGGPVEPAAGPKSAPAPSTAVPTLPESLD